MGMFDFVKAAGRMLGMGGDEAPAPDTLKKEVEELGLEAEDLQVEVHGETVKVTGKAASQEAREKIVLALGNVAGVSKVEESIETKADAPAANFYTVQRGDTLSAIAKTQYGKANAYMTIFNANKPMLQDPDKIYPGQVLRIPPAA